MPLLIVHDERTLADLSRRVLGRRGAEVHLTDAQIDAIRRANPNIDLDDLRPGTVLTIPDELAARADARPDEVLAQGIETLVSALGQVVAQSAEQAQQRADEDTATRRTVRDSLELRAVRDAARRDQELAAELARIEERVAAADQEAQSAAAERDLAVERWHADLDTLRSIAPS